MHAEQHNGKLPANFKERKELKEIINAHKRTFDDENYDEAAALVVKLAKPTGVPSDVAQLFQDPACKNLTAQSTPFWILLRAVKDFVETNPQQLLPLSGSLPDMKATSSGYLKLQTLYRTKAQEDLAEVMRNVKSLLSALSRPSDSISESDILTFVKHAAYVQVIRGVSLEDEVSGRQPTPRKSPEQLEREMDNEDSTLPWLVAVRAAEHFEGLHKRWPGVVPDEVEADAVKVEESARSVLQVQGWAPDPLPERLVQCLQEM